MIIVFLEFGKVGERLPDFNLSPPSLLIISFIILIALGTTLLMLPEMTAGAEALDFVTALFTSISASCVTGLSLIDISTVLSFKGQIIVMILMQLGGLNIISFAALFAILRGGFGMRQQNFMSENLGESMQQSGKLVGAIFRLTLTIELLGAVALGLVWSLILIHWATRCFTVSSTVLVPLIMPDSPCSQIRSLPRAAFCRTYIDNCGVDCPRRYRFWNFIRRPANLGVNSR